MNEPSKPPTPLQSLQEAREIIVKQLTEQETRVMALKAELRQVDKAIKILSK